MEGKGWRVAVLEVVRGLATLQGEAANLDRGSVWNESKHGASLFVAEVTRPFQARKGRQDIGMISMVALFIEG